MGTGVGYTVASAGYGIDYTMLQGGLCSAAAILSIETMKGTFERSTDQKQSADSNLLTLSCKVSSQPPMVTNSFKILNSWRSTEWWSIIYDSSDNGLFHSTSDSHLSWEFPMKSIKAFYSLKLEIDLPTWDSSGHFCLTNGSSFLYLTVAREDSIKGI